MFMNYVAVRNFCLLTGKADFKCLYVCVCVCVLIFSFMVFPLKRAAEIKSAGGNGGDTHVADTCLF